jgi:hypothetical protein
MPMRCFRIPQSMQHAYTIVKHAVNKARYMLATTEHVGKPNILKNRGHYFRSLHNEHNYRVVVIVRSKLLIRLLL